MVEVVAIDGPSGSGKSTVARRVAEHLQYLYLDTGAMYRAVALHLKTLEIPCEETRVTDDHVRDIAIDFDWKGHIRLNGLDVSEEIRSPEASRSASDYSKLSAVRRRLTQLQREIGLSRPSVLEGRDIGTVVFPDARHKFFLDATPEERARRRYDELISRTPTMTETYEDIFKQQLIRDHQDASRDLAPLSRADDAVYIDTTGRSIHEVVQAVIKHI